MKQPKRAGTPAASSTRWRRAAAGRRSAGSASTGKRRTSSACRPGRSTSMERAKRLCFFRSTTSRRCARSRSTARNRRRDVNRALALAAALLFCAAAGGAEPRFSFQSTPGKLQKDVVPKHYALRIVPAATRERFEGRAQIEIEVARPVAAIELNAVELDFDAARLRSDAGAETVLAPQFDRERETVRLAPAAGPIAAGRYRLDIDYTGRIARHPHGLHQVLYKQRDDGQLVDRIMLATQMEPVHARRLFPGWDEPVFRASFEITAGGDQALTAGSHKPGSPG